MVHAKDRSLALKEVLQSSRRRLGRGFRTVGNVSVDEEVHSNRMTTRE